MYFARRGVCYFFALVLTLSLSSRAFGQNRLHRATEDLNGREVVAGEVLVKFRSDLGSSAISAAAQIGAESSRRVGSVPGLYHIRSRSKSTALLLKELSSRSDVIYAEPNYVVHASAMPNDSMFSLLWGLRNATVPGADISATAAWDISTGSRANVVAIVDTGVDYNHQDLAANMWSAPSAFSVTIGGVSITCAAGTHGFNAITRTCDPMDDNRHGTHVAGTIGAVGNNAYGVVGVNWIASMMALKFLDSTGHGDTAAAIDAIEFAIQAKQAFAQTGGANVRILSNSWGGGGYSQALLDEINKANTSDMLFVVAAGNNSANIDTTPDYPASFSAPSLISVASTDQHDALSSFSNYGRASVNLAAPGSSIYSTLPSGAFGSMSGTSMATPHVSGAAALVLSVCNLGTADLKSALLGSVDLIPALAGATSTGGRLNVNKAIHGCSDGATVLPQSISFPDQAEGSVGNSVQVSLINRQTSPLSISSINAFGPFAVTGGTCGTTVAPGASCTVLVAFSPTGLGYATGTLTIVDDSTISPHVVGLAGIGVPQVGISPLSLTFPTQLVGSAGTAKIVTVTNNGSTNLTITSIGTTGDFGQTNNCIPSGSSIGTIAGHASCTISVAFAPTSVGAASGALTITDDAPSSPQTVPLLGQGAISSPGRFLSISPMNVARQHHTANLLSNGKVLIVGGTTTATSSELFDPATKSFALLTDTPSVRRLAAAVTLPNGKALVTGGRDSYQELSSTLLFDPDTGAFAPGPTMTSPRDAHTATVLNNGKVLITGGCWNGSSLSTAELYDPVSNAFTPTGSMNFPRCMQQATLLANGSVLVTGGTCYPALDDNCSLSAEVYDPSTGIFTRVGNMNPVFGRGQYHTGTLLKNGKALIVGGVLSNPAPADLYDPATRTFTAVGSMPKGDGGYTRTATLLDDGRVLFTPGVPPTWAAGCTTTCAQIYDPFSATFSLGGEMETWRDQSSTTRLADGTLLIAGGVFNYNGDGKPVTTAQIYQPPTATSISLVASEQSIAIGGSVTFTASVAFESINSITGSVRFFDGGTLMKAVAVDVSGTATLTTSALAAGQHSITATYAGDAANSQSTSASVTVNVGIAPPVAEPQWIPTPINTPVSVVLTASNNPTSWTYYQPAHGTVTGIAPDLTYTPDPDYFGPDNFTFTATNAGGTSDAATISIRVLIPMQMIALTPGSLTFPPTTVGMGASNQKVTLTNNSPVGITITPTLTGPFGLWYNYCTGSIAPGASCAMFIGYVPLVAGPETGILTVDYTASSAPLTIELYGTGVPQIQVSPTSLTFPATNIGFAPGAQRVGVTNSTGATITIAPSITGSFYISSNSCAGTLAPNSGCYIFVNYLASAAGQQTGQLTITPSVGSAETVSLTGTGTGADIQVSPTALTFAATNVGSATSSQRVGVLNRTGANITISSALTGAFRISVNTCTGSIAPNNGCYVFVQYRPTAVGQQTGTLTITPSAGTVHEVSLTGTGQ